MTAQVEFFCTPDEEREILRYLTKADETQVFDVGRGQMTPWTGLHTFVDAARSFTITALRRSPF